MKKLSTAVLALILAILGTAAAQDNVVISPQSIVVNPSPSFDVEVFVDKDTSGESAPVYNIGESIRVGVSVSEDAYVYLYSVHSNGTIEQILPNRLDDGRNNFVSAGSTRYFPPQNARYTFDVAGPQGLDKVIAVASREPLDLSTLRGFSQSGDFSVSEQGEDSFAQTLSIVVSPIAQEDWVTDTAIFYVGSRPSVPAYGTISITSNPSGAAAYVDGSFVGYTPVRFGTRRGEHTVRVERNDYETFETTISLSGGARTSVDASLNRIPRTGTASFQSQPRGAEVYVNGSLVGTTPTGGVTLNEGSYTARFTLPGYDDVTTTFTVNRGGAQTVGANLQPLLGSVQIQANVGGAQVFINGEMVGTVPNGSGRLTLDDLPTGTHELVIVAPGFNTVVRSFEIRGGQTTQVRVSQSRL